MNPVRIYEYLIQTRERVLEAVRSLPVDHYERRFDIGLKSIGSTLAHLMVSEWYYFERLQGLDVPPYELWPIQYEHPPALNEIERSWREQWTRIRELVAAESKTGNWNRTVTWLSFPDDTRGNRRFTITCTAGDLFTQLALHEMHHRAQVLAMLRVIGHAIVEDIDYNALMFQRVEVRS